MSASAMGLILLAIRSFTSKQGVQLHELVLLEPETKAAITTTVEADSVDGISEHVGSYIVFAMEDRGLSKKVIGYEVTPKTWEIKIAK